MTTYCPSGHRVAYADTKPAKCPSCGIGMAPPPRPHIPSDTPAAAHHFPRSGLLPDRPHPTAPSDFTADDFDRDSIRLTKEPVAFKLGELVGNKEVSLERPEPRAGRSEKPGAITTASLVADMMKDAPPASAPSPAGPRAPKAPRAPRVASASRGKKR